MVTSSVKRSCVAYATAAPFVVFALFPFAWMLATSLKRNAELYDVAQNPFWTRQGITWDHYGALWTQTAFPLWLRNSTVVSLASTAESIILGSLAAYALARLRFRYAEGISVLMFLVYLIPTTLLFLPLARIVAYLHLSNSLWSLILTYPGFMVPIVVWMVAAYLNTIPRDVEESALVDGCTPLGAFWRVLLPIARPGIITAALIAFTLAWGEFIYALTFISVTDTKTVTAGVVVDLIRGDVFYWGPLMAGAVLASLPVVLLVSVFLGNYVSGLTAGAVKG